jgi:Tol biopolymer transport system component
MWHGDRIFFLSDRDENQRMNLFVYDTKSKETRKLTDFTEFDVKFPSWASRPSSSRTAATFTATISTGMSMQGEHLHPKTISRAAGADWSTSRTT